MLVFQVSSYTIMGDVTMNVTFVTAPANDMLDDAQAISGSNVNITGSTVGASSEEGEPSSTSYYRYSVWYQWTATATGLIRVLQVDSSLQYSTVFMQAFVYNIGEEFGEPVSLACSSTSGCFTLRVIAGQRYAFQVQSVYYEMGDFRLQLRFGTVPPNDMFSNRTVIVGDLFDVQGSSFAATHESEEPSPYYTDAGSSVWYEYRPDGAGYIQIWFRPEFNGFVQAFSFSVFSELEPSLNALEYRYWSSCFLDYNCYQVLVDPSVVVFLQVDGYNGDFGDFHLYSARLPPPSNDNFADREVLPMTFNVDSAANILIATVEEGESLLSSSTTGNSVWYEWTAPASGVAQVSTANSNFDTIVAVFTNGNDSLAGLATIIVSSSCGYYSRACASVLVEAGETLIIEVDGEANPYSEVSSSLLDGGLQLNIRLDTQPTNDNFLDRIAVSLISGEMTVYGTTLGASHEQGERCIGYGLSFSVWYQWTALADGVLQVRLQGSEYSAVAAVYVDTNGTLAGLISLSDHSSCNGYGGCDRFLVPVVAGETYAIQVDSANRINGGESAARETAATVSTVPSSVVDADAERPSQPLAASARHLASALVNACFFESDTLLRVRRAEAVQVPAPSVGDDSEFLQFQSSEYLPTEGVVKNYGADGVSESESAVEDSQPQSPLVFDSTESESTVPSGKAGLASAAVSIGASTSASTRTQSGHDAGNGGGVSSDAPLNGVSGADGSGAASGGPTGFSYRQGDVVLTLTFIVPPSNDNFQDAIVLEGDTPIRVHGSNNGATSEVGEPNINYYFDNTVWYLWTPESSVYLEISFRFTSIYGDLSAKLSTVNGEGGFASLTSMSSVSYGCRLCTTNCYTCQSFLVSAGVPVALQIAGMYGSMGEFDLQLFFAALPSNDNFEDRVVLLGPTVINGSTIGATREPFEPYIGYGASASVWYTYTATRNGAIELIVVPEFGQDRFIPSVVLFRHGDSLSDLERIYFDSYASHEKFVGEPVRVVAGVTYDIAVDGYDNGAGIFSLQLIVTLAPRNDDFKDRTLLSGANITLAGSNIAATHERYEPLYGQPTYQTSASVWYQWQAPASGVLAGTLTSLRFVSSLYFLSQREQQHHRPSTTVHHEHQCFSVR